jgi:NifB/MoaA-like Fe-S oxidoreductase
MYRRQTIRPVEHEDARDALKIIESFQKRFKKKYGDPLVYGADEIYIKAETPFPPLKDYGDLPQIENGVGMVTLFMSHVKKLKMLKSLPAKRSFLHYRDIVLSVPEKSS